MLVQVFLVLRLGFLLFFIVQPSFIIFVMKGTSTQRNSLETYGTDLLKGKRMHSFSPRRHGDFLFYSRFQYRTQILFVGRKRIRHPNNAYSKLGLCFRNACTLPFRIFLLVSFIFRFHVPVLPAEHHDHP